MSAVVPRTPRQQPSAFDEPEEELKEEELPPVEEAQQPQVKVEKPADAATSKAGAGVKVEDAKVKRTPSFEADSSSASLKSPVSKKKPPASKKSAFDEPDDDVIDAEDLDEASSSAASGKSVAGTTAKKAKLPSKELGEEVTPSKAAVATIKIAGKELPRTHVIAGGGLALVVVAGLIVMLSGGSAPPVQTTQKLPQAPQQAPVRPQQASPITAAQPKQQVVPPPVVVEAKMIEIPAGEYMIGRNDGSEYEKPAHKVTLKAFAIDIREVTKQEYAKFVEATGRKPPEDWEKGKYPGRGDEPVTGVDWNDAMEYAKWAGKRLPTEQEWEVAASGKEHFIYPWGNEWKDGKANTREMGLSGPQPAGKLDNISPFGLYDTVGNVWEWTASEPTPYPGARTKVADASKYRVVRGGAWNESAKTATTMGRNWVEKEVKSPALGFRCAKDLP